MAGEIFSLVGMLSNLVSGITADKSHAKTEGELQALRDKQTLASSWNKAEGLYRSELGAGLPGYESEKEDIYSQLPTTISEGKDFLTSGGLVDYLAKSYTKQNQSLRQLNSANDAAKIENKRTYGNFLTQKAGAETSLNTQNLGLDLAKVSEETARTQDKLNFANKGTGSIDPANTIMALLQSPNLKNILAGLLSKGNTTNWTYGDQSGSTGEEGVYSHTTTGGLTYE